jgi:CheY-like chemotaxis protein
MDGYEACKAIKRQESTKHIPVMFLSAKAQQSDIDLGGEYGVSAYLTKPFDPTELLEVIARLTNSK